MKRFGFASAAALLAAGMLAGCAEKGGGSVEAVPTVEETATPIAAPTAASNEAVAPADAPEWFLKAPYPPRPATYWFPSENFRVSPRTPETVDSIAIHTTEGGYRDNVSLLENQRREFQGNANYLQKNDRSVSASFLMGFNGEIVQLVDERDVSFTTTYYNDRSFGIENAGWGSHAETWTPELMESLVNLCAYLCAKWGIPPYHPEGNAYEGPWSTINDDGLCRFTAPGLIGHLQVQPWNKSDPGPYFPWDDFCTRVQARMLLYGCEPMPMPEKRPDLPAEYSVTAEIPESAGEREPFSYKLVVEGPGVVQLGDADVRWPRYGGEGFVGNFTGETNVRLAEGTSPQRTEASENRVVYEATMTAAGSRRPPMIIPPKVKINGYWYDPGVKRITVIRKDEPAAPAPAPEAQPTPAPMSEATPAPAPAPVS